MDILGDDKTNEMMLALQVALGKMEFSLGRIKEGICWTDHQGKISWCNEAFSTLVGKSKILLLGNPIQEVFPLQSSQSHPALQTLEREENLENLYEFTYQERALFLQISTIYVLPGMLSRVTAKNEKGWSILVVSDVTMMQEQLELLEKKEQELLNLAYKDPLTGLPNRHNFEEKMKQEIAAFQRRDTQQKALFLFDIDHFKLINDSMGHDVGDLVLEGTTKRCLEITRDSDFFARIGGDEFALLLTDTQDVQRVAERLLKHVSIEPLSVGTNKIYVTISLGIAPFRKSINSTVGYLKQADIALYLAKKRGRNTYVINDNKLSKEYEKKITFENNCFRAVKDKAFFLVYQPQYDLRSNAIIGVEALLRLRSAENKVIDPEHFIHYLEKSGLMKEVGEFVLKKGGYDFKQWTSSLANLDKNFTISINVSPYQLTPDFCDMIATVLELVQLDPHHLILEITESILVTSLDAIYPIFEKLKELGLRLSIDDFGVGQSSLARLTTLPVSIIKIDRSFISNLDQKNNQVVVGMILDIGKSLGLDVIAEGIESEEQRQFLLAQGCKFGQGFYWSKPVAEKQLFTLLSTQCA